jgi:hypothetical protein
MTHRGCISVEGGVFDAFDSLVTVKLRKQGIKRVPVNVSVHSLLSIVDSTLKRVGIKNNEDLEEVIPVIVQSEAEEGRNQSEVSFATPSPPFKLSMFTEAPPEQIRFRRKME